MRAVGLQVADAGLQALALDVAGDGLALAGEGVQVLTVRPGYVVTKMTAGLGRKPLSTTTDVVAKATVNAMAAGKELIWVPWYLRYLMMVMKLIPRFIFRRLKF